MKIFSILIIATILSCSQLPSRKTGNTSNSFKRYSLQDKSGEFLITRQVKAKGPKLIVKKEVFSANELNVALEKTISVSDKGSVKTSNGIVGALRPNITQHTIWYEKQKFFTQLKLNPKNKTLEITTDSPEAKWSGTKTYPVPKGSVYCFFSQIPECVKFYGLISNRKKPVTIQVIWDNYPYHQEMYDNVSADPFEKGLWAFDKATKTGTRFGLLLGNQVVLYEFDRDSNFLNMYWVAQGISITGYEE